jgi:hypothetical protein
MKIARVAAEYINNQATYSQRCRPLFGPFFEMKLLMNVIL